MDTSYANEPDGEDQVRTPKKLFHDFDEETYLQANPDIRQAVAAGTVSSGLEHYRRWGRDEGRPGGDPTAFRGGYQPAAAVPPDTLRLRVSGSDDYVSFDDGGRLICNDLLDTMAAFEIGLAPDHHVLDFGCGCGRVLRHFAPQFSAIQFEGTDIDSEAIAWCQTNFRRSILFHHNAEMPPLPLEDARFNLIYSVSVFTHLPEDMQSAWLKELARVARPGAWLLLSVHSTEMLTAAHGMAAEETEAQGFVYHQGDKTDGLPDFYRSTFHAGEYIRREWGKVFDIEAIVKKGINNHQDLVVARAKQALTGGGFGL